MKAAFIEGSHGREYRKANLPIEEETVIHVTTPETTVRQVLRRENIPNSEDLKQP